jgi:hypothetical protein
MFRAPQRKNVSLKEPVSLFPRSVVDPKGPLLNGPSDFAERKMG